MYAFVVSYGLFIGEFLFRELFLRKKGVAGEIKGGQYDKGSTLFAVIFIVVGFLIPIILHVFDINLFIHNSIILWFGIFLMVIGIAIQIIAVKTLGRFYARTLVIQEKHSVIKTGIYKYLRHPGYLGGILVWEGFGLGTGNWIGFIIITILTFSFYFYRITMEEKMLMDTFGKDYANYAKTTSRLIPYIY